MGKALKREAFRGPHRKWIVRVGPALMILLYDTILEPSFLFSFCIAEYILPKIVPSLFNNYSFLIPGP